MNLLIERVFLKENYTIGKLYIDSVYFCDTLEDTVRGEGEKIYGKTAIPVGEYKVMLTYSPKFKKNMPAIIGVPMFTGIRIHAGNSALDTEGCILIGVNNIKGRLTNSVYTYNILVDKFTSSAVKIHTIKILVK